MTFDEKVKTCDTVTLNLAWNGVVYAFINLGVYNKFIFFDQSKIAVRFYGTVPGLKFNGGRRYERIGKIPAPKLIEQILWLNKRNIGFNFTFNTPLINSTLLKDTLSNQVLQACRSPLNGVVCTSPILSQYIRAEYPEYQRYASCILNYEHIGELEKIIEQYDIVVLPEDINPDFDYLGHIQKPEKIEIILNSNCIYRCPFRAKHWRLIHEEIQRDIQNEPPIEWAVPCVEVMARKHDWVLKNEKRQGDKQFIFPEMLPKYLNLGIRHFKFLDRGSPPDLELLLDYWITLQKYHGSPSVP